MEADMIKNLVFVVLLVVSLIGCTSNYNAKYPLHAAAYSGSSESCRHVLDSGVPIQSLDDEDETPLHAAVMENFFDTASFLLERGAEVNPIDREGNTPLHYAAALCNDKMIKLLLDRGAKTDIGNDEGNTALHNAAQECRKPGNEVAVNLLSAHNSNLAQVNKEGLNACDYAILYNNPAMVAAMRRNGMDQKYRGFGKYNEALRKPSFYEPPSGSFIIPSGFEQKYALAVEDCNHLLITYKGGLVWAGPVGYAIGYGVDKVRIDKNFNSCMETMGFVPKK